MDPVDGLNHSEYQRYIRDPSNWAYDDWGRLAC